MSCELKDVLLLVVDVDGTITDERLLIDPQVVLAIRELEKNNVTVCFASGNALPVVKALSSYLGASGPIIAEIGCVIDILDEVYTFGDPKLVRSALEGLKRKYGNRIREHWSNRYRHVDIAIRPTVPRDELESTISSYGGLTVLDSKYAYHIHPKGVDKGTAIEVICRMLRISLEEVASIGDSELEIPLFKKVGFSVAVANAPEELKSVATKVTSSGYSRGFLEFARELIKAKSAK